MNAKEGKGRIRRAARCDKANITQMFLTLCGKERKEKKIYRKPPKLKLTLQEWSLHGKTKRKHFLDSWQKIVKLYLRLLPRIAIN